MACHGMIKWVHRIEDLSVHSECSLSSFEVFDCLLEIGGKKVLLQIFTWFEFLSEIYNKKCFHKLSAMPS